MSVKAKLEALLAKPQRPSDRRPSHNWGVVTLIFFAMVLNYCDRQIISLLKPALGHELGWSERDYANIVFGFQAAYAASYVTFGGIVDRIGAKASFATATLIWSIAQALHGLARSAGDFIWLRALLGAGEGGSYPSGLSIIANRFGKEQRAFATGVINAGVNIGAIVTPIIVPALIQWWGWRGVFLVSGLAGLIWVSIWLATVRPALANMSERTAPAPPFASLLRNKACWAYAIAKFIIDPVWWLYLFWLPDYLNKAHGLNISGLALPVFLVFLTSDVGNIVGGWFSSQFIKRGITTGVARKSTLLVCALLALPIIFLTSVNSLWLAVGILCVATAAHQAFSVNLFTIPSDLFPPRSVGRVIGFGGAFGAVGGMLMAQIVGRALEHSRDYTPIFLVAAPSYLLALTVIHAGSRGYRQIKDGSQQDA